MFSRYHPGYRASIHPVVDRKAHATIASLQLDNGSHPVNFVHTQKLAFQLGRFQVLAAIRFGSHRSAERNLFSGQGAHSLLGFSHRFGHVFV